MQDAPLASSFAIIIPSPAAMRQAVNESPLALGFVPESAVDGSVKPLRVTDLDSSLLTFPVLAISSSQPAGSQAKWLECLQEELNP